MTELNVKRPADGAISSGAGPQTPSHDVLGHILDHESAPPDGFVLSGKLALIEPAGPVHYLDVDVAGRMVKATCADPSGLQPRATLTLTASQNAVHLFDLSSGLRLPS